MRCPLRGDIGGRHVAKRDAQPALGRHGIAGVDGQVDDHLFDLARIGKHRRLQGPASISSSMRLAEQLFEQRPQRGDQRRQIEHLLALRLAAGKGQQLRDKPGGAHGRCGGFRPGCHVHRRLAGWPFEQLFGHAQYGGEDVVEIMRDTASELAHGLHAGDRGNLRFQSQLFANVAHYEQSRDTKTRRHRDDADHLLFIRAICNAARTSLRSPTSMVSATALAIVLPSSATNSHSGRVPGR